MIPDRHSSRFDSRWLLPFAWTDESELFGAPEPFARFEAEAELEADAPTCDSDGVLLDRALDLFDRALEQVATDGCRVCPLCGLPEWEAMDPPP